MELPADFRFDWAPMEEQPQLLWATMEQLELSWTPEDQGLLADQQFRLASAAAIQLQVMRTTILIYFSGVMHGRLLDEESFDFHVVTGRARARTKKKHVFFPSKSLSAFVLLEFDRLKKAAFFAEMVHREPSPPQYVPALALVGGPSSVSVAGARGCRRARCKGCIQSRGEASEAEDAAGVGRGVCLGAVRRRRLARDRL